VNRTPISCRSYCGACCTAPSIASPIPGMPAGKPAGVPCIQLDEQRRCKLYGLPERPSVCRDFSADESVCGASREQAMRWLGFAKG
jgi:uncharacterized protein